MTMKGGNPQNLKVPTSEEARKNGRAGGIASGHARRERRQLRETLDILLKMPIKDGPSSTVAGATSLKDASTRNAPSGEQIGLKLVEKALMGDIHAIQMIQEVLGEAQAIQTVSPLDKLAEEIRRFKEEDDGDRIR